MTNDTPNVAQREMGKSSATRRGAIWAGILLAYAILFSLTGYIAFFQEPYNPAANPSDRTLALLKNEPVSTHLLEALKEESAAFKARKDLAAQSFNVVLGALLGFLSASAAQRTSR